MWVVRATFLLLGVILLAAAVKLVSMILQDQSNQHQFDAFLARYNKTYTNGSDDTEFYRRFRTFEVRIHVASCFKLLQCILVTHCGTRRTPSTTSKS